MLPIITAEKIEKSFLLKILAFFLPPFKKFITPVINISVNKKPEETKELFPKIFRGQMIKKPAFLPAKKCFDENLNRDTPFILSLSLFGKTEKERREEFFEFIQLFSEYQGFFRTTPIIELNCCCSKYSPKHYTIGAETQDLLDILFSLKTGMLIRVNSQMQATTVWRLSEHPECLGISISEKIPLTDLSDWVLWTIKNPDHSKRKSFKMEYSGKDLTAINIGIVAKLRAIGMKKPIINIGDVFSLSDVWNVWRAGGNGISVSSTMLLRSWKLWLIIPMAYFLFRVTPKKNKNLP